VPPQPPRGPQPPHQPPPRPHGETAGLDRITALLLDTGLLDADTGELWPDLLRREALRLRDRHHPGMSDAGAFAVYASARLAGENVPALRAGLNELPPYVGTVSCRVDLRGKRLAAFRVRYREGAHVVEPAFLRSDGVGAVELRIESKTGRDARKLTGQVVFPPGTQLRITAVEHDVVHAEEIAPGDPRRLGPAEARQAIEARIAQETAEEAEFERDADLAALLAAGSEPPPPVRPRMPESPAVAATEHPGFAVRPSRIGPDGRPVPSFIEQEAPERAPGTSAEDA
jgi:hypothetical protein